MLRRMRLITTAGASLALAAGLAAQSAVDPSAPASLRVVWQNPGPATVIEVGRIR